VSIRAIIRDDLIRALRYLDTKKSAKKRGELIELILKALSPAEKDAVREIVNRFEGVGEHGAVEILLRMPRLFEMHEIGVQLPQARPGNDCEYLG